MKFQVNWQRCTTKFPNVVNYKLFLMFQNSKGEGYDLPSSWKTERSVTENGVQTADVSSQNTESQTVEKINVGVQTDPCIKKQIQDSNVDYNSLAEFLRRVSPAICKYLEKNSRYHPYDNYKLLADNETSETKLWCNLTNKTVPSEFRCLDFSWNSTGNVIAIGYGASSHDDWCTHDSVVATWNLQRKDFNSEKPNLVIESGCCVTSLTFHPEIPAVLAGGKFNGEIIVWNISKDDDMLVVNVAAHRELITGLQWIKSESEIDYLLISCSLDGQILVWRLDEENHKLMCIKRFILLVDHLPRSLKIKSKRPNAEVGITSLSFNSEDQSIFIIGTEGGGVFQCSMNSEVPANYTYTDVLYNSPVVVSFDSHLGHVGSVHCSPHSRNAFLSCSSDGEIHIYSLLQSKPVLILKTLSGFEKAEWSPVRPLVLAALTKDCQLVIYDLDSSTSVPSNTFKLSEKENGCALHFNAQNSQLLAVAAVDLNVQVWQLGTNVTAASSDEKQKLSELLIVSSD